MMITLRTLLLPIALSFAFQGFPQSMKMVVDSAGNVVGRYVRTNADTYTVGVQDIFDVAKAGKRIVKFRAKNGQGIIWCRHIGRTPVYSTPSTKSDTIGHLVYDDGYVPETYPCMGKKKGWYMVRINGKAGYVRKESVGWDGMDTF